MENVIGIIVFLLTELGAEPSNILCWDRGRMCRAWSGLVRMKSELGHSLTKTESILVKAADLYSK